jgi:hypothetical protein
LWRIEVPLFKKDRKRKNMCKILIKRLDLFLLNLLLNIQEYLQEINHNHLSSMRHQLRRLLIIYYLLEQPIQRVNRNRMMMTMMMINIIEDNLWGMIQEEVQINQVQAKRYLDIIVKDIVQVPRMKKRLLH